MKKTGQETSTAKQTLRDLALSAITSAWEDDAKRSPVDLSSLSREDRALYSQLVHGTLREWFFIEELVREHAKKKVPKPRLRPVLWMGAYQILFLDRVPVFAIFNETKRLMAALGLSEAESAFVFGILKKVAGERASALDRRRDVLARAQAGQIVSESAFELSVLNVNPNLLDALTVTEEVSKSKAHRRDARHRALRALASMKESLPLVGYFVRSPSEISGATEFVHELAPRAIEIDGASLGAGVSQGLFRVQGIASQWASEFAAKELAKKLEVGVDSIRVLEMSAGRGGKLISTISAMAKLLEERRVSPPRRLEWVAVDAQLSQLALLEREVRPLIEKYWPWVELEVIPFDWQRPGEGSIAVNAERRFDLVWLDAPCTGFGTIAKLPEISLKRGAKAYEEAKRLSVLQHQLAGEGVARLSPSHGVFLYTVCTLTRPETYDLVQIWQKEFFENRKPIFLDALWPGEARSKAAEGFFLAAFELVR